MKRLLILHGWGSCRERWKKVEELLKSKGIEVLIPELPGFGSSPAPKEVWGSEEYAEWALEFLEKNKWQRFNLLGHSFGGSIAAVLASKHPEMIEKLILCSPAIIRKRKRGFKILIFSTIAKIGKKFFSVPELRIFYPFFRKVIYKLSGSRDYYLATGIMKKIFKKVIQTDLGYLLKEIKNPTLILWGEKDDQIPVKYGYFLKERIRNSKLVVLPKIKHSPHREAPERLIEEIISFID